RRGRYVALSGNVRYSGLPVRDWTLRGRTMQSLKVKSVNQERATIGPISDEAARIIGARNRIDHMWGMSPSDTQAMQQAVFTALFTAPVVKVETEAVEQIVA